MSCVTRTLLLSEDAAPAYLHMPLLPSCMHALPFSITFLNHCP
jgi:hypothetical protein